MNAFLRRAQLGLLVALVLWVAVHTVLVWQTGWTSWRWGGFGMYAEPTLEYRASAIVACEDESCTGERADVEFFAPGRDFDVPVLQPTPSGEAPYRLVGSEPGRRGELSVALEAFRRMPTRWHAEGLVRARLAEPCGPYLVVLYTQHVSMLTREATVDPRPFVVSLPSGTPCKRIR
jgi:hypothetical protein